MVVDDLGKHLPNINLSLQQLKDSSKFRLCLGAIRPKLLIQGVEIRIVERMKALVRLGQKSGDDVLDTRRIFDGLHSKPFEEIVRQLAQTLLGYSCLVGVFEQQSIFAVDLHGG